MERKVITANGDYTFACPIGATFAFAASGTFDSGVITAQYNSGMTSTSATNTLTINGVVVHGETVTIGDDVYCFAADEVQTVGAGQIAVDITAVATASEGTLTLAVQPTAGDTITIGDVTYEFVEGGAGAGEISRGADLAAAKVNTASAIRGSDGVNSNALATCAEAFSTNDLTIIAKIAGAAGDLIATTSSFTDPSNGFDAVTLGATTAGVDCVQADAVAALVAADAGTNYSLADGAGDTVVVTATAGPDGNLIATETDMANGAWDSETLTGGTDPIDRWKPFATTAITLNAAGEKTGVNVGAHAEINLNVASIASAASIVVVFNVLPA
jgi:hypothetical protein